MATQTSGRMDPGALESLAKQLAHEAASAHFDDANAPDPDIESSDTAPLSADSLTDRTSSIAVVAYWLAERRGFYPGHELDDWLEAEKLIDAVIPRTD